jgi:para-aminobenzoate synthetase component 1
MERLPDENPGIPGIPDAWFTFPGLILQQSPEGGWSALYVDYGTEADIPAPDRITAAVQKACMPPLPCVRGSLVSNFTRDEYCRAIEAVRNHITDGDIYQANISRRFSADLSGDPYPLFVRVLEQNPAPFFAFLNCGNHCILSSSPELLIRVNGSRIESKPIKGTVPRGASPAEDKSNRERLIASRKDNAELSMIVDLIRNDIGRVCVPGSVRVENHREVQEYTNVYHTVSTVSGELPADRGFKEIMRAVFPGGSVTGCPKIRSMEIIDSTEKCRRHVYTGSIGMLHPGGDMVFNIAIRTAIVSAGRFRFSAGGGIVYDSDPGAEFDETTAKAETWLRLLA